MPGRGRSQAAALPWAPRIPDISRWLAQRLAPWLAAEVAPGRLMPWLPVAFGTGIVFYFSADREPAWWAPVALALALAAATIVARRRPVAFPLLLAGAAVVGGLCDRDPAHALARPSGAACARL